LELSGRRDLTFIQISTDEVYGSIEEGSFREDDALDPSSPYSSSKAGADLLARAYHKTYGLPVMITRSSNNFGPYQYPEKIILLFILNTLQDKPFLFTVTGEMPELIYALDNCEAVNVVLYRGRRAKSTT